MLLSAWVLIAHLIGDYVLQSHVMALKKTQDGLWALLHATLYGTPYAALLGYYAGTTWISFAMLLILVLTHAVIDRYRLAVSWCRWYGVGFPGFWMEARHFQKPPPELATWLPILVDNTLHLTINTACIAVALYG